MASEQIKLDVIVDGEEELKKLSSYLRNLAVDLGVSTRASKNLDANSRSLNKALGNAGRGATQHAKSVRELITNQSALSKETKKLSQDLTRLQTRLKSGAIKKSQFDQLAAGLNKSAAAMKKMKARAFISDLRGIGVELKRLGKDAQFVGRSLIIGLTMPMIAFARKGLSALKAYDAELIRFAKIIGEEKEDLGDFENQMFDLSQTFGIARELLTGISADFAELGISSADAVATLTKITAEMSVLGGLEMSASQELTQTMYLGMMRTLNAIDATIPMADKQERAMASVNAQLALFNAIENNTALSFRDLAVAMPEAQAAATAFGLSMTETAALLAPMKAAGIDVNAAASGFKVSLQRLVSPTKALQKEQASLVATYDDGSGILQDAFDRTKGTGVSAIQGLIDSTIELKRVSSDETVLRYYDGLFRQRQSTRMLTSIEDLIQFQRELNEVAVVGSSSLGTLLSNAADDANRAYGASLPLIKTYEDVANVARIANTSMDQIEQGVEIGGRIITKADKEAADSVRGALSEIVRDLKKADDGFDLIDSISSQGGKAMFVQLLGARDAQELANQELNVALGSTSVAIDRIKNSFKNMAADLISQVAPAIENISQKLSAIAEWFRELPGGIKNAIIGFGLMVGALGPLVFIFGQLKLASGVMLGSVLKFVPGLTSISTEALASHGAMMNLRNGLTRTGDTIVNTNGRFATLIATLASGEGKVGRFFNKFGTSTGILSKTRTATDDVVRLVDELNPAAAAGVSRSMGPIANLGATGAATAPTYAPLSRDIKAVTDKSAAPLIAARDSSVARTNTKLAKQFGVTEAQAAKFRTTTIKQNGKDVVRLIDHNGKLQSNARLQVFQREKQLEARRFSDNIKRLNAHNKGLAASRAADINKRNDFNKNLKQHFERRKGVTARAYLDENKLVKDFAYKNRQITEAQARALALGGSEGRAAKREIRGERMRDFGSRQVGRVKSAGSAAKGATVKAMTAPFKAAKAAVNELNAAHAALGASAPGRMRSLSTGTMGFVKSMLRGVKATQLLKFTLVSSGIGAVLILVGAAVMVVMKNMDNLKKNGGQALDRIKKAFNTVKDAVMKIINPILDLMASIANMGNNGKDAAGGMSSALDTVAMVIEKIANAFSWLVDTVIVPVVKIWTELFFGVFKLIAGFVKGFMEFFKGNWKAGFSAIWNGVKGFFISILRVAAKGLALMSDAFFGGVQFIINLFATAFKWIVKLVYWFVGKIVDLARIYVDIWSKAVEAIPNAFSWAIKKAGGFIATLVGGVAKAADSVSGFFNKITFGAIPQSNFAGVEDSIRGFFDGVGDSVAGMADGLNEGVLSVFDSIAGKIMSSQESALGFFDSWGGALDGAKQAVGDFFRNLASGTSIAPGSGKEFISEFFGGAEEEDPYAMMDELLEPTFEASEDAGEDAGEAFADKFKDALDDIRQEFVDLVGDYLSDEISKVSSELVKVLEDQKDSALAVFEEQLDVLDKLEQAEQSLTREREYQLDLRKLQDERELNRQNYVRNRALAIYEGRIDDARMLDREEKADQIGNAASIDELQRSRNEQLRKENLDFLKNSIKEAKKEAQDFFKEQIDAFKEASKEITKFAPQTIEDYQNQLDQLKEKAQQFANENADAFATTFDEMNTNLVENMPNKVVNPFAFELDSLVAVAVSKYGLGAGEGSNTSVIGATLSMLDQIETNISTNTGINTEFQSLTDGLSSDAVATSTEIQTAMSGALLGWETLISSNTGISTEWSSLIADITDKVKDTGTDGIKSVIENHGPQAVLEAAIAHAEATILNKWRGTIDHVISEVNGLANLMDPMIANILETQMAFEAMEEAARNAGSAASDAGSSGGGGSGGSGGGSSGSGNRPNSGGTARYNQGNFGRISRTLQDKVFEEAHRANTNAFEIYYAAQEIAGIFATNQNQASRVAGARAAMRNLDGVQNENFIKMEVRRVIQSVFPNSVPVGSFAYGGKVPGVKSGPFNATLHGGEYVINSKAVSNIGLAALQSLNNMRFNSPRNTPQSQPQVINTTNTTNIYVENFIGEDEWFNSMIKEYNMKVKPMEDKKFNTQDRFYTTYKGAGY